MRAPPVPTHVINEGYFLRHEECKWLQRMSGESWKLCEWEVLVQVEKCGRRQIHGGRGTQAAGSRGTPPWLG